MKARKTAGAAVLSLTLAVATLAACTPSTQPTSAGSSSEVTAVVDPTTTAAEVLAANQASHAAPGDTDWDPATAVDLPLSGSLVTITEAGTYRLHGTLSSGQVVVNAPGAVVRLVLDGVSISNPSGAAIAVLDAEEAVLILADGSVNELSDASSYADGVEPNAALYSAADLTIGGTGRLTVYGNGNDAIASQDGLVIESGTITVDAVDDGIRGKDYVIINGGTVVVAASGDGLKADNADEADRGYIALTGATISITAGGDATDAATDLVLTGGSVTATAGGGHTATVSADASAKGLKSGVVTVLEGGTAVVDSADDAVHSNGSVRLAGATVTAASGDDGVHADDTVLISAGSVDVTSSYEGLEAAFITLTGGTVQVVSSDDGVNASDGSGGGGAGPGGGGPGGGGGESVANVSLTVTGGTLVINAGGDGFDSNGTATITGGVVVVNGPTANNNGALDVNGNFTVTGGVLAAAGSAGMAVAPSTASGQGWVAVTLGQGVPAGTTLHLVSADGAVLATFTTSKTVQSFVFSSAEITSGSQYRVFAGGTATGADLGGLAESGSLGSATEVGTVTAGVAPQGGFGR